MINHISIGTNDPEKVAKVLAEIWNGYALPFPHAPQGWMVFADDGRGSLVEVTSAKTVLVPGGELPSEENFDANASTDQFEAQFVEKDFVPEYVATHLNVNSALNIEEIKAIAKREGWRCFVANRGGLFQLIELWIENRFMLEVLTPEMTEVYVNAANPQNWADILEMPLPPKSQNTTNLNLIG